VSASPQLRPRLVPRETEVTFDQYVRIYPGEYYAHCTSFKTYRDPIYKRWVLRLRWDVLPSNSSVEPIARDVPMFFGLGVQAKPHAGRRSKYFAEWLRANGGPPSRVDRLSGSVFVGRAARVQIADTDSPVPYSVVRAILGFETGGSSSQLVSQSGNQVRQGISGWRKN
jgi:hypothetical protein